MKSLVVFCALLVSTASFISAQDNNDRKEARQAAVREAKRELAKANAGPAVSAADVGDADSFGKNAQFLGVAASGTIYIYNTCDPAVLAIDLGLTLGPDDRCVVSSTATGTPPATVVTDIARITIPGKTVSNIIYTINNHTVSYDYFSPNTPNASVLLSYNPQITIESDALNDPNVIDPSTGNPAMGSYTTGGNGTMNVNKALLPGYFESETRSYSRANTLGFSRAFWQAVGLSNQGINQLFKKPVTIRLGASIRARNVDFAVFTYTARFLGN
jgi:hypothetical protein